MNSILKVDELSKHYLIRKSSFSDIKIINAVQKISFEMKENESLGLIGESGCGKSTTANMILRLLDSSAGKIQLFGVDITDLEERSMLKYRKDLQIIPQYAHAVLDPKMTIEELIKEPLQIHHIVEEKDIEHEIDRLLELVGISPSEKWKFPSQLSGGQNQRIIIARAIASRPKLIVCDEPVSALDISVQGQVLNLFMKLKKELNLAYLFISHDLKVVRHMCERIAVMYNGEIVEIGLTEDIMNNPQHDHTKRLLEATLY